MGTQQILMIVLSVIVVGAAIAVGIAMFDTQATNNARNAVSSQIAQFAVDAQGWYRTPRMMGGADTDPTLVTTASAPVIARHLHQGSQGNVITMPSGLYRITIAGTIAGYTGPTITIDGTTQRPRGWINVQGVVGLAGADREIIVTVNDMSDAPLFTAPTAP